MTSTGSIEDCYEEDPPADPVGHEEARARRARNRAQRKPHLDWDGSGTIDPQPMNELDQAVPGTSGSTTDLIDDFSEDDPPDDQSTREADEARARRARGRAQRKFHDDGHGSGPVAPQPLNELDQAVPGTSGSTTDSVEDYPEDDWFDDQPTPEEAQARARRARNRAQRKPHLDRDGSGTIDPQPMNELDQAVPGTSGSTDPDEPSSPTAKVTPEPGPPLAQHEVESVATTMLAPALATGLEAGPLVRSDVQVGVFHLSSEVADDMDELSALIDGMRRGGVGDNKGVGGNPRRLDEDGTLADRFNEIYRKGVGMFLEFVHQYGLVLLRLRREKSGHFQEWVEEKCVFTYSTASGWMRIADRWDKLIEKCDGDIQRVVSLPLREALAMVAEPRSKNIPSNHEVRAIPEIDADDREASRPIPGISSPGPGKSGVTTNVGWVDDEVEIAPPGSSRNAEPARPDRGNSRLGDSASRSSVDPSEVEGDGPAGHEASTEVHDAERAIDGVEEQALAASRASQPTCERPTVATATTVIAEAAGIGTLEKFEFFIRQHDHKALEICRALSKSNPDKFRSFWNSTPDQRNRAGSFWAATHFSQVNDCEKCGGSGLVAPGRRCKTCASMGYRIYSEIDQPIDDAS